MKKVFVLGGTGFLGYHTVKELLKQGYEVRTMSLPPMPSEDLFPKEVESSLGNINDLSDEEVLELLKDVDGFVYAIGADERWLPEAPAYKSFYEANVRPTQRIARLCAQAGVKDFVVYGSYFAEFAERLPEFKLKDTGYAGTRLLQEQIAFAEGEGKMNVSVLRLPYIFGTMPGRVPLWKMFTDLLKGQEQYPVAKGGTAMVSAEQVAQATVGALKNHKHRKTYAISDTNMKHREFYEMMVDALGQDTVLLDVPYEHLKANFEKVDAHAASLGKEHGIPIVLSQRMNQEDLYIDPAETMGELGITPVEDMRQLIKDSLKVCVEA